MFITLKTSNTLSINIFELSFYQDQSKWKHEIIPIEPSESVLDRIVESLIYKNHYVFNKNLDIFLGGHSRNFVYRIYLNSYTSQNL